jgi:ABC-type transporter Mla subunit MlaD
VVTSAGAADSRTYQAELFNAFGLVKGSELRVAGVKAGTVTELDTTEAKTALITFEVGPEFPEFNADASCSSEPQSLIAEYFLDCQPGSSEQPLTTPIPAARNQTTVQTDLVQNTLREPFKRRFQLLINEFGTALVGNAENLNAAIRAGAPALQQLKQVLNILGRQNRIIAGLNADSDAIFQQLTDRREDVVRFIDNAGTAAAISAERREDLAANFDLLDDFLFELRPVMHELGNLAREQTPLLTDLRAAAPGLNKLGGNLPRFNNASRQSLESLGGAARVGKQALGNASDEIAALNRASTKAFPAADIVAEFLESLDDPASAVEEDCEARRDLSEQPGEADRRQALLEQKLGVQLTGRQPPCPAETPLATGPAAGNPGYTGLEGLLNYTYIQTNSLNLFDQLGHALHFTLVNAPESNECTHYHAGPDLPSKTGGHTTNPADVAECGAILGDKQPNINYGTNPSGLFGNLHKYDGTVCPDGSTDLRICDPNQFFHSGFQPSAATLAPPPTATPQQDPQEQQDQQEKVKEVLDKLKEQGKVNTDKLREVLGLPQGVPLPQSITQGLGTSTSTTQPATNGLLDFLFGP